MGKRANGNAVSAAGSKVVHVDVDQTGRLVQRLTPAGWQPTQIVVKRGGQKLPPPRGGHDLGVGLLVGVGATLLMVVMTWVVTGYIAVGALCFGAGYWWRDGKKALKRWRKRRAVRP
jgi:hypothetical protein